MRIVHFSNNMIPGGAGKAARTINEALIHAGMQSARLDVPMITKWDALKATFRAYFDKLPIQFYNRKRETPFSTANIGIGFKNMKILQEAEIIHLHWVHQGYMGFSDLDYLASLDKKVFINMHDSWWLTGGCHVTHGCNKWQEGCGSCPQLNSSRQHDLSWNIFHKKQKILKKINPIIICASRWMFDRAQVSPMFTGFKICRIPYCIDYEKYKPIDKIIAREKLNLPLHKKLILFGSVDLDDPNKGYIYFREAVNLLENRDVEIVIFGNLPKTDLDLKMKVNYLGLINDDNFLALVYSAADIFVAPSLEDNFPNTVLESISCGTPVVAFNIGGMPDMITHEENGFLAEAKSSKQLNLGITHCLLENESMGRNARNKVMEEFSFDSVAKQYLSQYHDILLKP